MQLLWEGLHFYAAKGRFLGMEGCAPFGHEQKLGKRNMYELSRIWGRHGEKRNGA